MHSRLGSAQSRDPLRNLGNVSVGPGSRPSARRQHQGGRVRDDNVSVIHPNQMQPIGRGDRAAAGAITSIQRSFDILRPPFAFADEL